MECPKEEIHLPCMVHGGGILYIWDPAPSALLPVSVSPIEIIDSSISSRDEIYGCFRKQCSPHV
jgi:hypothetical protein